MFNRFLTALTVSALALVIALPAGAATSWNWTDISDQLTLRTNRPVWAMAYANGSWFYTDGQDLWNGGQVYRYDGAAQVNITLEVRNAGLSRVDDIVADGTGVLFVKDIYRLDNAIEGLLYRNGGYTNVSSVLRQSLDVNEGISSIVGRNGTWFMVSTRARLVSFPQGITSYTRFAAPTNMVQLSVSDPNLLYSAHNRFDRTSGIMIAPVGNNFLLGINRSHLINPESLGAPYQPAYFLFNGSTFQKLALPSSNNSGISGIAFNPTQALVFTDHTDAGGSHGSIYTFDGVSWSSVRNAWYSYGHGGSSFQYFSDRSNFSATWDGSQWMLISGKKQFQIANSQFGEITVTKDYFITAASNNNGTMLVGGTVSDEALSGPSSPLTAKLLKVTNTGVVVPTITPGSSSTYGVAFSQWISPSTNTIARDQTVSYSVNTQDSSGLLRTDIYVNGVLRRTCDWYNSTASQTCTYTLLGSDYAAGTTVSFNAKVTDSQSNSFWTALMSLSVIDTASNTGATVVDSGSGITSWAWLSPSVSSLKTNETATYSVGAWDSNGLKRIEILVNGLVRRTCDFGNALGNQTCSFTLIGSEYAVSTNVSVNAKITEAQDKYTWTPLMTLSILSSSAVVTPVTPPPAVGSPATWVWSIPPETTLISTMATYHVGSWDADGISRIDIWVNGTVRRSCTFPAIKGNVECSWDVLASDYSNGSEVFVNASVSDAFGNVTWAASKSWRIQANTLTPVVSGGTGINYNPNTVVNLPGSVTVTSNHDSGYNPSDTITYTATASDQNVLDRIELYVNGVQTKVCYNVASCSWTGGPYGSRPNVTYGATMVDKAGYALWTGYKTINKF